MAEYSFQSLSVIAISLSRYPAYSEWNATQICDITLDAPGRLAGTHAWTCCARGFLAEKRDGWINLF